MAVYLSQAEMIDEFLDENEDRAWTIDELHEWADSRTDPEFWRDGQNARFLYEGQCDFLRKEANKRMLLRAQRAEKRGESPPDVQRARAGSRGGTRHAVPRRDPDGNVRYEHDYPLNLTVDEACRQIQQYLDMGKDYFRKARELHDTLVLQYSRADARKLREFFKDSKTWQQAMVWEEEDLVG